MKKKFGFLLFLFFYLNVYSQTTPDTTAKTADTTVKTADTSTQSKGVFFPGDALKISAFPDTGFPNGVFHIDGNGYVNLPIIGKLHVVSKSEEELVDFLKKNYVDFMRYPYLQVEPLCRVSLLGGFRNPGLYWVPITFSLWDVIRIGGGPTRQDGIKKMRWERDKKVVNNDLVGLFQSGMSLHQINFQSGDQICVTDRPQKNGWDILQMNAIPLLSFTFSAALSVATIYQTYKIWKDD